MNKQFFSASIRAVQDESDDIFEVVISSDSMDRHGEILMQEGFDFTNWLKNPVFLWAHDYSCMPVAKGLGVVSQNGGQTVVRGQWAPVTANPQSGYLKALWKGGFLNTVSVGFLELERQGNMITKMELLEVSFVPVPANQDALAIVRQAGLDEKGAKGMFEKSPACYTKGKQSNSMNKSKRKDAEADAEAEEMKGVMEALHNLEEAISEALDKDEEDMMPHIKDAYDACEEAIKEALEDEEEEDGESEEEDEEMKGVMEAFKALQDELEECYKEEDEDARDEGMKEAFDKCEESMKEAMDTEEEDGDSEEEEDADQDDEDEEEGKGKAAPKGKSGRAISAKNSEVITKAMKLMTKAFGHSTKAHGHLEEAIASLDTLVKDEDEEEEESEDEGMKSTHGASSKKRSNGSASRDERRAWIQHRRVLATVADSVNKALANLNKQKPL